MVLKDGGVTRFQVPKGDLNFIVDKYHVGTPDDEIRANIRMRVGLANARRAAHGMRRVTDKQLQRMEAYAIERHHANQELYAHVMGGR